jgi:hypothetical protein
MLLDSEFIHQKGYGVGARCKLTWDERQNKILVIGKWQQQKVLVIPI